MGFKRKITPSGQIGIYIQNATTIMIIDMGTKMEGFYFHVFTNYLVIYVFPPILICKSDEMRNAVVCTYI